MAMQHFHKVYYTGSIPVSTTKFMKKWIKLILGILLVPFLFIIGGRSVIAPEKNHQKLYVEIFYYDNKEDMPINKGSIIKANDHIFPGYSFYRGNHCIIFALEPRHAGNLKLMEILGHEFLHCTHRDYHVNGTFATPKEYPKPYSERDIYFRGK